MEGVPPLGVGTPAAGGGDGWVQREATRAEVAERVSLRLMRMLNPLVRGSLTVVEMLLVEGLLVVMMMLVGGWTDSGLASRWRTVEWWRRGLVLQAAVAGLADRRGLGAGKMTESSPSFWTVSVGVRSQCRVGSEASAVLLLSSSGASRLSCGSWGHSRHQNVPVDEGASSQTSRQLG